MASICSIGTFFDAWIWLVGLGEKATRVSIDCLVYQQHSLRLHLLCLSAALRPILAAAMQSRRHDWAERCRRYLQLQPVIGQENKAWLQVR
jgi:hypothetical protein